LTIFVKPLINWIWIGSGLMVIGAVFVLVAVAGRGWTDPRGDTVEE
jgi:cytochrome c biogenesis factor